MPFFSLPDRGLIRVSGPDALGFLQNLLTQDVRPLRDWEGAPALLLEAGGKIRFDMYVLRREPQVYMLDCALADLRPLGRALSAARVAERFSLEVEPAWQVVGFLARPSDTRQTPENPENREEYLEKTHTNSFQKVTDTRHPKLGWRLYASGSPKQETKPYEALGETPAAARMNFLPYGIVEGGAALAGRWPLVAGLDRLNYISWTKGCFPGHEVTARVHYKGKPKYAFRLFKAERALPASPASPEAPALAAAREGSASSSVPKGPPLMTRQRRPIGDYICHQDTYLIAQVLRARTVAGEQTDEAAKHASPSAPSENELLFQDHILRPWPVL